MILAFSQFQLVIGQFTSINEIQKPEKIDYYPVGLWYEQVVEKESVIQLSEWNENKLSNSQYLGIEHDPSIDFNIYLSMHNSTESRVQMYFDLSLNYSGVMNLRSRVLLRKRRSD